ncbi:MAG: L,D-transpeptidase [Chitinophagaceae bacterium]|nr:L,D-transpeptidase [Chitinophagaceae bacterium]
MKNFMTALIMLSGILNSCSTNSTGKTAAAAPKEKPVYTNPSTSNKTGPRAMQKYYRSTNTAVGATRIVIDKSDFELRVYDSEGLLAAYPVVFGLKPLEDKFMQGDRKTPEGSFKVVYSKQHQLWKRMLMLNYPTSESAVKFKVRKSNGLIPATATIGNGIGIHGVEPGNDYFIDRFYNWTNGCISLKNHHIEDLARYVKAGTPVSIQK